MRRPLAILCAALVGATMSAGVSGTASAELPSQAAPAAAEAVPDELLVGYVRGASASDKERARSRAAAQRQERVVAAAPDRNEVELVRLPRGKDRDQAIAQLENDPAVQYAEPNWVYQHAATSNDPYFTNGSLWGLKSATPTAEISAAGGNTNEFGSGAAAAWADGAAGSATVYVGVIDEGIQYTHPDLDANVWLNPYEGEDGIDNDKNGYVDDVRGWDFAGNDNTIYDGGTKGNADDHGTHVAGTIGARANGAGVVGVNHDVRMISGKFLGPRGGTLDNAVKAVDYFTDLKVRHGLNIVATNNSWGGGGLSQSLLDAIVRGAKADILFVAAAGNSGSDNDASPSYPSGYNTTAGAGYDAVVAVAAIDAGGALAGFSQYGLQTVDLGAPGVGIWSTTAPGKYESYNGTSMATPHVTGAVALYEAAKGNPSAAAVRSALLSTAVPTRSLQGKTSTGGRLNIPNALLGIVSPRLAEPEPSARTVSLTKRLVRNYTEVTVTWSGFGGTSVVVDRGGDPYTTPNDGHHTENWRGSGTVTYTLCEVGSTTACATASIVI